jgi:hypothetical protein
VSIDLFKSELDALVLLAEQDAWKAYAWHRARQLERCKSRLWIGLPAALVAAMKAKEAVDVSGSK